MVLLVYCAPLKAQIAPKRVGSDCSRGEGPFFLRYGMPKAEHIRIVAKMEDYIWSHWKSQRTGCVTARFITAEAAVVDVSLYVETDDKGALRTRIERKTYEYAYGNPKRRYIVGMTQLAYRLLRVDERELGHDDPQLLSDSAELQPGTYAMLFRDKDGQNLYRLEPANPHN
jgi:hypothetical protein